jgi:hypothetical protein
MAGQNAWQVWWLAGVPIVISIIAAVVNASQ